MIRLVLLRRLLLAIVVATGASAVETACKKGCQLSSQCNFGQHCDFTRQTCVDGCKSNSDCAPAVCDTPIGRCIPNGTSVRTSTTPDSGPFDSASIDTASIDSALTDGAPADGAPGDGAPGDAIDGSAIDLGPNDAAAGDAPRIDAASTDAATGAD